MYFFAFEASIPLKLNVIFCGVGWGGVGGVKSLCLEGFELGLGEKD